MNNSVGLSFSGQGLVVTLLRICISFCCLHINQLFYLTATVLAQYRVYIQCPSGSSTLCLKKVHLYTLCNFVKC